MLDKRLVAEAAARLKNPVRPTAAVKRMVFARMVASSQRLEGVDTTPELVLEAADAMARQARATAS